MSIQALTRNEIKLILSPRLCRSEPGLWCWLHGGSQATVPSLEVSGGRTGGRRIARGEVITFELTWVETSSLSLGPGPRPWHHNPFWTQAPASDWSEVKQYWLLIGWEPPLSRSAGHPHCQLFGCFLPSLSGSWQTVFVFSDSHFLLLASAPQIVIGIKTEQIITWTLEAKSSPG